MFIKKALKTLAAAAASFAIGHASAQELVIWHDLGDNPDGRRQRQALSRHKAS